MALTTHITIAGNLTRDPELRYTQGGQPVASFTVASTPRSYNKDTKQYEDGETIFQNCTLWGKPAENLAGVATKGARVIAAGQLKSRTYEARDGTTKTSTDLIADEVGLSIMFGTPGGKARPPVDDTYPATGGPTQTARNEEPW